MMNPYALVVSESKLPAKLNLAMYGSLALAAICAIAFGLDAYSVVVWYFRSGETVGFTGLYMGAALLAATLLIVYSETGDNPRVKRIALLVLAALVALTFYWGYGIANSWDAMLKVLRVQPSVSIGMAILPATWLYAGLVFRRKFSCGSPARNS